MLRHVLVSPKTTSYDSEVGINWISKQDEMSLHTDGVAKKSPRGEGVCFVV